MTRKMWGATLELVSVTLALTASQILVPLYGKCAPAEVGALFSMFGAVFFTVTVAWRKKFPLAPKDRSHRLLVIIVILIYLPETQLKQIALNGAGIAALTAVTTAGLLAVTTWRLVFGDGRTRPWHATWQVIALVGVVLLVQPFSGHGPSLGGIAAALLLSMIGIAGVVSAVKLAVLDLQPLTIALLRWTSLLVALPILLFSDHRWMSGQVIAVTMASALIAVLSNWTAISANKLARSDGLLSSVGALTPVVAMLIGLIAGATAPDLYGWLGSCLVVAASATAIWILNRRNPAVPKAEQ